MFTTFSPSHTHTHTHTHTNTHTAYTAVASCNDELPVTYLTPVSVLFPMEGFVNPTSPRAAAAMNGTLTREQLMVAGLEEYQSYSFSVAMVTEAGSSPAASDGVVCAETEQAGMYIISYCIPHKSAYFVS